MTKSFFCTMLPKASAKDIISSLMGRINSDEISLDGVRWRPGTVLCGTVLMQVMPPWFTRRYKFTLLLYIKPEGWNDAILKGPPGSSLYLSREFSQIIGPDPKLN